MKRWAALIVAVYVLMLAVISAPLILVAFEFNWQTLDLLTFPAVWTFFAVMGVAEALLLFVPPGLGERRPRARRKLLVPVIASAFFMATLVGCTCLCVFLVLFGDKGPASGPLADDVQSVVIAGGGLLAAWVAWGILFYQFYKSADPDTLVSRLMRWLVGGSVLELLVAVPSHVIVRHRGDCCAPAGTFFGISTGIAVMLMAFGPGVLLLYAKRMERLRGHGVCRHCGYDLRATPDRCPECGCVPKEKAASAIGQGGSGRMKIFLSARWVNLALLTYRVPAGLLSPLLPAGCVLDRWPNADDPAGGDHGYVSLVAFDFLDTRVMGVPWPGFVNFPEINLRFYVRCGDKRGVCFVREYVPSRLVAGIANRLYNEPYRAARMASQTRTEGGELAVRHSLRLAGRQNHLHVHARLAPHRPPADSIEHFFKEHRWGFGRWRDGSRLSYEVIHPEWDLYPVVRWSLSWDWAAVYGKEWALLQDAQPLHVMLAAGSGVTVSPKG